MMQTVSIVHNVIVLISASLFTEKALRLGTGDVKERFAVLLAALHNSTNFRCIFGSLILTQVAALGM